MALTDISILFDKNAKLQQPIIHWLHTAMGFDLKLLHQTRFIKTDKLSTHARVFYKTVWYQNPEIVSNATHHYSIGDWLNLIAHEMYHRKDMGNNIFSASAFGISYVFHWVKNWMKGKNPYHDNPHEISAFEMGCSNNSKVNKWLKENDIKTYLYNRP